MREEELQETGKILTRNAEKATYKYLDSIRGEIMELQRTQYYDLMYVKTKKRG